MEPIFWRDKWQKNELGFHKSEANPLLIKPFSSLSLAQGKRVCLPLCGKTLDIAWLLAQGYRVAGAELVELAIAQLFNELDVTRTMILDHMPNTGYDRVFHEMMRCHLNDVRFQFRNDVDSISDFMPNIVRVDDE